MTRSRLRFGTRVLLTGVHHDLRDTGPNTLTPAAVAALHAFTDGLR
ncbi:hypothetical protein ACFV4N_26150 [Actinosynnema sp. NPDC059797]